MQNNCPDRAFWISSVPQSKSNNDHYLPHLFQKLNPIALLRDRRLSAKLVPNFTDRGCRVVSTADPHGRVLGFLDWGNYYFFQVAPQLYSRGLVDPVPDPLLLRKSGSAWNRTWDLWICSQEPTDHRGGLHIHSHCLLTNHPSIECYMTKLPT
jgi:hypothetical protein